MKVKNIVLISFVSFILLEILFSCAQIVAPTGGKKDTLSPVITKTFPVNQATNFRGRQVELEFNEYVTIDNIQQQLLITPNIEGTYETKINKPLEQAIALNKTIRDIKLFSSKADSILEVLVKSDSNWFVGTFLKMIK